MSSLEISHLKVSLGQKLILNDLSFSLAEGQIAALLGPSGCGKTTLLRSIAGLIQPSDGTIRFGKQLVSLSSLVMPSHKRKIGYVPQEGALFPHLSVADNIAFGLDRSVFTKDQIRQTTKEMLNLIGLQGFENRMPNQLSGGQQTRVALARALAIKPAIVLLDEPFSALDAALRGDLRADVIDLLRKSNATAILVTHDREEALVSADVVALMRDGQIIQQGTPEAVYSTPISPAMAISTGDALVLDASKMADGTTSYLFSRQQRAPWLNQATLLFAQKKSNLIAIWLARNRLDAFQTLITTAMTPWLPLIAVARFSRSVSRGHLIMQSVKK